MMPRGVEVAVVRHRKVVKVLDGGFFPIRDRRPAVAVDETADAGDPGPALAAQLPDDLRERAVSLSAHREIDEGEAPMQLKPGAASPVGAAEDDCDAGMRLLHKSRERQRRQVLCHERAESDDSVIGPRRLAERRLEECRHETPGPEDELDVLDRQLELPHQDVLDEGIGGFAPAPIQPLGEHPFAGERMEGHLVCQPLIAAPAEQLREREVQIQDVAARPHARQAGLERTDTDRRPFARCERHDDEQDSGEPLGGGRRRPCPIPHQLCW